MPSPLVHITAGFALGYAAAHAAPRELAFKRPYVLYALSGILAVLPDFDSVFGLLAGDFGRYHHNLTHSVFLAVALAVAVSAVSRVRYQRPFGTWFAFTAACYGSHVLLDYFTWGRGVMAFWPLTDHRYSAPVMLFYGVRWSEGMVSHHHLWTALTEGAFIAALGIVVRRMRRRDHGRSRNVPLPEVAASRLPSAAFSAATGFPCHSAPAGTRTVRPADR